MEPAVEELRSVEADSSRVSQVSLSVVPLLSVWGLTALSRRMPGRDEEDEWNVDAGRVDDEEWNVVETPARRGVAAGMLLSDSEPESRRVFRGRGAEDDGINGDEVEVTTSEEST